VAKTILSGELPSPELLKLLQPETIQILRQLIQLKSMGPQEIRPEISVDNFISCYKHTHEKPSSSPSGHHVGHCKAACQDPTLAHLHSRMMSIPFQTGFSARHWRKVIDMMLQKDVGSPRIHRLRIIALLESGFNQAVRILIARQLGFWNGGQPPHS
jgi:hypothetical protein